MTSSGISSQAVAQFFAAEQARFLQRNPRSQALAERARQSLFGGVPMHWMADWSTPCPLFVERAKGARFHDVDGHEYIDFCLGDTGSMFGHSPEPVAKALAEQAGNGLTTMLPGEDALVCGELLAARFGLPYWQVTATATDANRYVLRWARAITQRNTLLVFDGCYHGTLDDVMVRQRDGRTQHRSGLIGQAYDLTEYSRAIPFNDIPALEAALAQGDVCALLCEPAMTNIGMVLPDPGFLEKCRELTRKYGALLIIDETHTISTDIGGCTRLWNLEPDFFVLGKPIAGGVPCGVYGCSAEMASAMQAARQRASAGSQGHGHSGMGTTLSANALAMHCMRANLEQVMTVEAYQHMLPLAQRLAEGLRQVIRKYALAWSVTELGARCEFQFCARPPRNGAEAEAAFHDELQMALHLYLINRGILITPFHNMTLCCPQTTAADVDCLLHTLEQALGELLGIPGARL
ncbi:aspartate aminotransferase family protein [Pseudomonas fluvialis]|jgi:glutamate-1-semialdehyde 2,1-aminomutase|uniref:Aspartate aminotransferase family protein n=1 Tax=Pseudomonas fluvialis TaxID=1793966 RepID=A0ABQ2AHM3_9PSED|nr:aspartate aminotransferase family protein [Pseudomonas fluvialis]MBP8262999.1 aspartate aminotransferase family protein [Pseudomonas sp.]OXM39935.1 aspartate aminotransferase family protein [Pseudomonas fluvialis]GGH90840.1 aspartate aminotransferase family protein [Pseudomonas fluvialis]